MPERWKSRIVGTTGSVNKGITESFTSRHPQTREGMRGRNDGGFSSVFSHFAMIVIGRVNYLGRPLIINAAAATRDPICKVFGATAVISVSRETSLEISSSFIVRRAYFPFFFSLPFPPPPPPSPSDVIPPATYAISAEP